MIDDSSSVLIVRNATARDAATIAVFNTSIAAETEDHVLQPKRIVAGIAALLADSSKGRYWVAEVNGIIAGQIMVTYEWSDWRNGFIWWIQSVYVHEDHRRKGVFSALYQHVESLARGDEGVVGLRLYVDACNQRAQDTYISLGMQMRNYLVMEVEFGDEQT